MQYDAAQCKLCLNQTVKCTGVDLSKIVGGTNQNIGGQRVAITDENIGVSQ